MVMRMRMFVKTLQEISLRDIARDVTLVMCVLAIIMVYPVGAGLDLASVSDDKVTLTTTIDKYNTEKVYVLRLYVPDYSTYVAEKRIFESDISTFDGVRVGNYIAQIQEQSSWGDSADYNSVVYSAGTLEVKTADLVEEIIK